VEERFQALESLIRQLVRDRSTSPSRLANSGAAQANGGTVVVLKQSPGTAQRMAPPRIAESGPMSATQASESLSPGPPKDVAHSADSADITVQTHAASPPARLKDLLSASQEITSKCVCACICAVPAAQCNGVSCCSLILFPNIALWPAARRKMTAPPPRSPPAYMCMYMYIYMYACMCVCIYVCMYERGCVCVCTESCC
jgi:hypothetical protein